jgi:predicted Zn-dependent peptidase
VIVVAGNVTSARARRLVEQSLNAADWSEAGRPAAPENLPAPEQIPASLREVNLGRPSPASVFAVGYLAPGTLKRELPQWAALMVLDTVLGGGKATRLFRLRDDLIPPEQPVGYEIRTLLIPSRTQSLWTAYVIGNNPTEATRTRVLALLTALGTGAEPVTDEELVRAKAYLKGRHAAERQHLKDRSYAIGWAETMGLGARFESDFDTLIEAVKVEEVMQLGRQMFGAAAGAIVSTR